MTSSNTFKKIISIGSALLLAVGGSLSGAMPAQATGPLTLVTVPTYTPTTNVTTATSLSSSYGAWSNAPSGTGGGSEFWRICDSDPSLLTATDGTDVPANLHCHTLYTSWSSPSEFTGTGLSFGSISALDSPTNTITTESLVGKYIARISIVKLYASPNTLYGWAFSTASLIGGAPPSNGNPGPTITGTASVGSVLTATSGTWNGTPTSYRYQWVNKTLSNGMCGWSSTDISGATASTYTVQSSDAGKCINVMVWASNANGESANSNSAWPEVQIMGSVSNNNNQNNNSPTVCAGQTGLTNVTLSVSTVTRTGTYRRIFNNDPTLNNCYLPQMALATGTYVNGTLTGTISAYASIGLGAFTTDRTLTLIESLLGRQLAVGDVITFKYWSGISNAQTAATSTATFAPTLTITGDVSDDATDSTDPVTEDKRPLPVWASNIVKSIPTLTKSLNTAGGAVSLTDGDYADLKSVTIGGKAVAFKIETTGNVSIPVPAGQAGKTADIVIVFAGGTMTVQDGIKYVAVTDVAKVIERPIAIAAGAKKLTEAVADQIRQAAFANMTNTTVQCVAYASKNTAAAKAAAKLTAIQACGIAAAANPALKVSEVSVIVNKAKAKKQAVGIKVYK